jgi:hypothetical protein
VFRERMRERARVLPVEIGLPRFFAEALD